MPNDLSPAAAPVLSAASADSPATRLATRLSFFVAGFAIAAWAPLVPFVKDNLAVDEQTLGMLILCLGLGSVTAMLFSGALAVRFGTRPVVLVTGFALALLLPLLPLAATPMALGAVLFAFGAMLGSLDVAMNVHAVEVERAANKPLMSGFHALFSVGGLAGAAGMTFLLSRQWSPLAATLACAVAIALFMLPVGPRLLHSRAEAGGPLFVRPRGRVLLLAGLAAVAFLAEGALLDWSALLLVESGLLPVVQGGLGYLLFSVAMTAGRLCGDALTARVGDRATVFWGGLLAVGGFALALLADVAWLALAGFVLIGLGASNIVPVLFRRAGAQHDMPAGLAIAAMTTTGYAGILVGPAAVGFVAKAVGLPAAFWMLAGLLCLVPLCAGVIAPERRKLPDADPGIRSSA